MSFRIDQSYNVNLQELIDNSVSPARSTQEESESLGELIPVTLQRTSGTMNNVIARIHVNVRILSPKELNWKVHDISTLHNLY